MAWFIGILVAFRCLAVAIRVRGNPAAAGSPSTASITGRT